MSSSTAHARETAIRPYTPEQWSRRMQVLQTSIYGPPVSQTPPLNVNTDVYGQPQYPETRGNSQIPQVVNASASEGRIPGRSDRHSYATNADARAPYGGVYYDDSQRPGSTSSRANPTIEDVRPLYRDKLDKLNTRSPDSHRDYAGRDSGYLSGEGEDYGREFGERRRSRGYDSNTAPPSAYGGGNARSRRVSEYGTTSPQGSGSKTPSTTIPLRGILHHRPTHGSMKGEFYESAYEARVVDFHEDPSYTEARHREPRNIAMPAHGTPYPTRSRRLSDAEAFADTQGSRPPSQGDPYRSRPTSVYDGPVIPGQTTHSPQGHSSRPPTMYGGPVAPILQSQERPVEYPPTRMSSSRPTSAQPFPMQGSPTQLGSSHRQSTTIHTPVINWNAPQSSGGARGSGREPQRIFFYHKNQPYYGFTNFSPHAVLYNGKQYPTSEHLFQSFKVRAPCSLLSPLSYRQISSMISDLSLRSVLGRARRCPAPPWLKLID